MYVCNVDYMLPRNLFMDRTKLPQLPCNWYHQLISHGINKGISVVERRHSENIDTLICTKLAALRTRLLLTL